MPYDVVVPKGSAPPLAPYSPGTKASDAVYVSGTLALDSSGKLVGAGDIRAQTRHVLETIKGVLEAAGGSLSDITFNHIFLTDMRDFPRMNEVYARAMGDARPARSTVQVSGLPRGVLVEIDLVAALPPGS